jgi:hypothetical protein
MVADRIIALDQTARLAWPSFAVNIPAPRPPCL